MRRPSTVWVAFRALAGFVIINLVLAASSRVAGYPPTLRLAVEAVTLAGVVVLVAALWPRLISWLKAGFAVGLLIVVLLKIARIAQRNSLDRELNLALDWVLLRPVFDMTAGTFGLVTTTAILVAVFVALGGLLWVFAASFGSLAALTVGKSRARAATAGAILTVLGLTMAGIVWPAWTLARVSGVTNRLVYEQAQLARETRREQAAFALELLDDDLPVGDQPMPGLSETDVLLVFVESYGAVALEHPEFAPVMASRLDAVDAELAKADLASASAWLLSPTVGGQSWLAHSTVISGLTVDNNAKYQALVASDRATLIDLFAQTGHRTLAIMPAITWPWPEGDALGYDQVYGAKDLGYRAAPFNWVTMPDQFVLSTLERLERSGRDAGTGDRQAIFAEIALISSHAPWTPIAELIDWAVIDDEGMAFDEMAQRGPTPAEVWSDKALVRKHYIGTLDYSLEVLGDYARRFGAENTLMIVLGDHQPAPVVTGAGASHRVPIHILAGDPALLLPFFEAGYSAGMMPSSDAAQMPMRQFRNLLVEGFDGIGG